jgi:hypothetical protein
MGERAKTDRLIVAELSGAACRHAGWEPPGDAVIDAAVAELREIAGGRADLLAEVAGVALGAAEGRPDAPQAANMAVFCRLAGAAEAAIPGWAQTGRERAARARQLPFSGGLRTGRPRAGS